MKESSRNNRSLNIPDIITAILLGVQSNTVLYINNSLTYKNAIITSFLSIFWVILLLDISNRIGKKFNTNAFKNMLIFYLVILLDANIISFKTIGDNFKFSYLSIITSKGFVAQAGLNKESLISIISFLVTSLVILALLYCIIFNNKYKKNGITTAPKKLFIAFLFLIIPEQTINAYGDFIHSDITRTINKSIPWHPNLTTKSLLKEIASYKFGSKINLNYKNISFNDYPITKQISKNDLPNIIFIMADSLRGDMMNNELMPFLSSHAGKIYLNNFSTSNNTHFGLFSILSGLFPHYYDDAVHNGYTPSLIKMAKELGYELNLISSAELSWRKMNNYIKEDDFDNYIIIDSSYSYKSDMKVIENFNYLIEEKETPKFFLLILNITHHNYYYPEDKYSKYLPAMKADYDIFKTDFKKNSHKIFNRYKNSVLFLDDLIKEVFNNLQRLDLYENSIIVVFGDHGEEFYEEGHIVHANTLNKYQLSAALYIKMPHENDKNTVFESTSSIDIFPTVFEHFYDGELPNIYKGTDIYYNNLPINRYSFSASGSFQIDEISSNTINEVKLLNSTDIFFNSDIKTMKDFIEK